ncbi:hypothetical protein RRG08_023855 [Elysia crispata]|uniref:Uncharacterized protein n=1 Tax=Elysia crispata TaxID=231223 RepID=A0AAE1AT74_9GAST|nr:hypothetical protein RRG08_023855 [Elysia crispata]
MGGDMLTAFVPNLLKNGRRHAGSICTHPAKNGRRHADSICTLLKMGGDMLAAFVPTPLKQNWEETCWQHLYPPC